jgi:hypothetical protein
MLEVVGRASAVHSTKMTVEVVLVGLAEAEEEESSSSSSEMVSGDVRGVPLQNSLLLSLQPLPENLDDFEELNQYLRKPRLRWEDCLNSISWWGVSYMICVR